MATTEELKEEIVELRMRLVRQSFQSGECPYGHYTEIEKTYDSCDDCQKCVTDFLIKTRKMIEMEVSKM